MNVFYPIRPTPRLNSVLPTSELTTSTTSEYCARQSRRGIRGVCSSMIETILIGRRPRPQRSCSQQRHHPGPIACRHGSGDLVEIRPKEKGCALCGDVSFCLYGGVKRRRTSTTRLRVRIRYIGNTLAAKGHCLTICSTLLFVADTITFRPDADASRALDVLTRDGTPISTAVRAALIEAARRKAAAAIRAEAEELAADELDRAEAMQVLRDMETLRAW